MTKLVIGLDLGTTNCKAVALAENGQIIATTSANYPLYAPQAGWAEQDVEEIKNGAINALHQLTQKVAANDIQGLCFSGAMHSVQLLDDRDHPIGRALTWADQRAAPVVDELRKKADNHTVYQRSGCPLVSIYFPAKLGWVHKNLHGGFHKVVAIKEYVQHQFTGAWATDWSTASATGLMDIRQHAWAPDLLSLAGISTAQLPPLIPSDRVSGKLTAAVAQAAGLPEGMPVVIGGSDGGMAMLGAGGSTVITVGTSGAIRRVVPQPLLDPQARTWCYVMDQDHWLAGGAINNGGLVAQWVREKFYPQESFELMLQEAAAVPAGSGGVVFLPYLSGERSPHWNPWERAIISGIGLEHSRGHIARAALEGVAFCLAEVWEIVKGAESARLTGGITRARLWSQILCDVLGVPLELMEAADASAVGAARLGWQALGQAMPPLPAPDVTLTPDARLHETYHKCYQDFLDRYRHNY
jgi:gluconokinase